MAKKNFTDESLATLVNETKSYVDNSLIPVAYIDEEDNQNVSGYENIIIDPTLSTSSTNAIQNKAVAQKFNDISAQITSAANECNERIASIATEKFNDIDSHVDLVANECNARITSVENNCNAKYTELNNKLIPHTYIGGWHNYKEVSASGTVTTTFSDDPNKYTYLLFDMYVHIGSAYIGIATIFIPTATFMASDVTEYTRTYYSDSNNYHVVSILKTADTNQISARYYTSHSSAKLNGSIWGIQPV